MASAFIDPRIAALVKGYSVGVTVRTSHIAHDCAEHLAAGTAVYIAALAGDDPRICIDLARRLKRAGLVPVPHIAARDMENTQALDAHLGQLAQVGVTSALIVAGDSRQPRGTFDNGLDLLWTGLFQKHQILDLGLPWHLEGHPALSEADMKFALVQKLRYIQDNGLRAWLLSQFCLAAAPYVARMRQVRAMGLTLPLIIGIAGPCARGTLIRLASRCHVGKSVRLLSPHWHQTEQLIEPYAPERLLAEIVAMQQDASPGYASVHVYDFGGLPATSAWASRIIGQQAAPSPAAPSIEPPA